MKKILCGLLVVTMLLGISLAVYGQTTLTITSKAGVLGKKPDLLNEIARSFEQQMAGESIDVKVKVTYLDIPDTDYKMKIATEFLAGKGSDVVAIDGKAWTSDFAKAGYLYSLTEFTKKWASWEQYYPAFQDIVTIEDNVYALMWDTDVRVIYYRKDLFKEAGLPVPWQPQSWHDILAACKVIKEKLGIDPFATHASETNIAGTVDWFLMPLYGAGGNLYDWEKGKWVGQSPALLDTFVFYSNLGKFMPVDALMAPRPWEGLNTMFQKGKLAMYVGGSWSYRYTWGPGAAYEIPDEEAKIDFAVFPAESYGKGLASPNFTSLSGGWAFAMNKNTQNPDLTWKLIELLYDLSYQARACTITSHLTPSIAVANSSLYKEDKFLYKISASTLPHTKIPKLSRLPEYAGEVQPLLTRTLAKIVSGRLTPEEALKEYSKGLKTIVGSDKVEIIK